ncbi:MAG: PfkB family carbohydrate kinase [Gemmatimonadetes bacterium]|nr:PfkB family carbohydrate kinase [Gemmatimonadota bacterium]
MTTPPPSILGVGTVSLDTVENGAHVARDVLGGSAPYFGAAARLYGDVTLVGAVGEDFPQEHLDRLADAGISTRGIARRSGETFRWHVRYQRDGSRETLRTNREVALDARPAVAAELLDTRALFLGSTHPALQLEVLYGFGAPPHLVVLDTMTHWIRDEREAYEMLARSADVVLLNEEEATLLGNGDQEAGIGPLLDAGTSWVVVKRGEEGAAAFGHDRAVAVTIARPRAVIDPTGAGDAFAGGLVGALARSWPDRLGMEEAMARGAALGSFAVESFSVDRLLEVTEEGVASRAREIRIRSRRHRLIS